jgi:hypothetical protein
MNSPDRDRTGDPDVTQNNSPYGPQTDGVDEAAGGADSSPYEGQSSEDKDAVARRQRDGDTDLTTVKPTLFPAD